jgi:hypothetical protein
MLHRNAFNISDYSLRGTDSSIVLRPRFRHFVFRLLFGGGLCAVFVVGALGLKHELRQMREARRLTTEELSSIDGPIQVQVEQYLAINQPEKAAAIKQDAEAMKAKLQAEREAEIARLEARDRPWEQLLRFIAGGGVVMAVLVPLTATWQRVRIRREGESLVIRNRGHIPRTRRIHISAVEAPEIDSVRLYAWGRSWTGVVTGLHWRILLKHQDLTIYLWWVRTPPDRLTPPPRVEQLISALQQLGSSLPTR